MSCRVALCMRRSSPDPTLGQPKMLGPCTAFMHGLHASDACKLEEPRMRPDMALAVASRSGLLAAMLSDPSPKTAEEWSKRTRASKRTTEELLKSLVGGQVVDEVRGECGHRFHVSADRAAAVMEMGAIFEALLIHQRGKMDPEATMNLVKFRCGKILACKVSA